MKRRALLAALPVMAASPATALCIAPQESPVLQPFRECEAEERRLNGAEGIAMSQAQFDTAMPI